jgi:hypothetical protein
MEVHAIVSSRPRRIKLFEILAGGIKIDARDAPWKMLVRPPRASLTARSCEPDRPGKATMLFRTKEMRECVKAGSVDQASTG